MPQKNCGHNNIILRMRERNGNEIGTKQGKHRNALKEIDESDYFNFLGVKLTYLRFKKLFEFLFL